jgi:hypothetical protein
MGCFRDEDLVSFAEGHASEELCQEIEAHVKVERCTLCHGFVQWLKSVLPDLPHSFGLAKSALIERTIEKALKLKRPAPREFDLATEMAGIPAGVRNLATDLEKAYRLGDYRLEIMIQPSLNPPYLDVVGLLDPSPPKETEVCLLSMGMPIEETSPDQNGRFRFSMVRPGAYEILIQLKGGMAYRTPPFEARST